MHLVCQFIQYRKKALITYTLMLPPVLSSMGVILVEEPEFCCLIEVSSKDAGIWEGRRKFGVYTLI